LQNGVVNFRTGCGIVGDSTVKEEWLEIHNKAKNLVKIFNYLR
jgi:anthranilate/para-aminobenzoate synthase component I